MKQTIRWSVACVALLLSACGTTRRAVVIEPYSAAARHAEPTLHGNYRVVRGDTLYSIAFRAGVDFRDLAHWNRIDAPYTIWPGQVLRLSPSRTIFRHSSRHVAVGHAPARTVPSKGFTPAQPPAAAPTVPSAAAVPASEVPVAALPPVPRGASRSAGGVQWRWPADGALIKRFKSGDAIPGIELAGKAGEPVRAAADGVVVYSGNGLVGYGELVIIKHNDSFLSAYGHNRKRLVKEGERVNAGQEIAEMGATGASRDELQFQIRQNGNPVDPLDYLPSR